MHGNISNEIKMHFVFKSRVLNYVGYGRNFKAVWREKENVEEGHFICRFAILNGMMHNGNVYMYILQSKCKSFELVYM